MVQAGGDNGHSHGSNLSAYLALMRDTQKILPILQEPTDDNML